MQDRTDKRSTNKRSTSAHAATLQVMTSRELFRTIASYTPGYTQDVIALAKRVEPLHRRMIAYQSSSSHNSDSLVGSEIAAGIEDQRLVLTMRGMLPYAAIKGGDIRMLESLLAQQSFAFFHRDERLEFYHSAARAVQFGRLDVLQWLHTRHLCEPSLVPWDDHLLRLAIRYRHVDIMDWLVAHYPHETTLAGAQHIHWRARAGNLPVLEWLHARGFTFTTREMDLAARHDHLADVQFLHANRHEGCTTDAMDSAAARGHTEVLAFLHKHRHEGCTTRAMDGAAANGDLATVQFLHTHRNEGCTTDAMDSAAANGDLAIVQFLHAHRHEGCTANAMHAAAAHGHAKVVAFLGRYRREGCRYDTLLLAAQQNQLEVVRALCKFSTAGCLFDARAAAERFGHNAVVKLLERFIAPGIATCTLEQHSDVGARRCGRQRRCGRRQ